MCAFTRRCDGKRICLPCRRAELDGCKDDRVFRALGALTAGERGYVPWKHGRYIDGHRTTSKLAMKTKALIAHDRILRGEVHG